MTLPSLPDIAQAVNESYPALRSTILTAADLAMENRYTLPGTGGKPYHVGNPIGWTANPVNDAEYVWGLNRMNHWLNLGKAALLTGEVKYANKIAEEWKHWIHTVPPPDYSPEGYDDAIWGVHPWRLLEVGIRSYSSWPFAWNVLTSLGLLTDELAATITASAETHARILSEYSPKTWPHADHNHMIMEMLGLLTISVRFPHLAGADSWKETSRDYLERCMAAQFTDEGGQMEGCPHYHAICVGFMSLALRTGAEGNVTFSEAFHRRYKKSVEYALQSTRPTGVTVPWGDSDATLCTVDSGVAFYLATGDAEPLRILSRLCEKEAFQRRCESHIWSIPDFAAFVQESSQPVRHEPPRTVWHRQLGQVTARSDWSREALSLFFACRTPVANGHSHIDVGGFDLCALGKPLLVDPGRFTYRNDYDRYDFKRASSHNTLLIDERDPFEFTHSWAFGEQRRGDVLQVQDDGKQIVIVGEHENYHPALHRRTLILVENVALVMVDRVSGLKPHQSVQLYFNVDSLKVQIGENGRTVFSADASANLAILVPEGLQPSLHDGRISEVLDVARPSTRVRLGDKGGPADRTYVTLLAPFLGSEPPSLRLTDKAPNERSFEIEIAGRKYEISEG